MVSLVLGYILKYEIIGYVLGFLGMIFEGEGFLFSLSFLTHQGFFNIWCMILTIFFGAFLGDILWYWLGHHFDKRKPFLNHWVEKISAPIDHHLHNRPIKTILISKFAYGFYHAILIRSGMINMQFKKFIIANIGANIVWITVIGGLGYFFSASLDLVKKYMKIVEILLVVALILFFAIQRLVSKKLQKEL